MSKILGLDIGTNSVGWAVVDTANYRIVEMGAKVFPESVSVSLNELRRAYRTKRRLVNRMGQRMITRARWHPVKLVRNKLMKNTLMVYAPLFLAFTTATLALFLDWQYWVNISVAFLIAFLSLVKK